MSQEKEHVHHYISIENVRFPDMTFSFEMRSDDFHIPALTIQPIVENAIKHGLMKLPKGGTIRVVSYETDREYCISVEDDGVGFDTNALLDERKHVGLRNIRERLNVMVTVTMTKPLSRPILPRMHSPRLSRSVIMPDVHSFLVSTPLFLTAS